MCAAIPNRAQARGKFGLEIGVVVETRAGKQVETLRECLPATMDNHAVGSARGISRGLIGIF